MESVNGTSNNEQFLGSTAEQWIKTPVKKEQGSVFLRVKFMRKTGADLTFFVSCPMLRIRDVYLGSRIRTSPSRIPDPGQKTPGSASKNPKNYPESGSWFFMQFNYSIRAVVLPRIEITGVPDLYIFFANTGSDPEILRSEWCSLTLSYNSEEWTAL